MSRLKKSIPLQFHDVGLNTSVSTPAGLPDKIDEILHYIDKTKGICYSRNSFVLKAIRFYLDHLLASKDMNELMRRIDAVEVD